MDFYKGRKTYRINTDSNFVLMPKTKLVSVLYHMHDIVLYNNKI